MPDLPTVPTAVVFDLGGVLIDWNPRHLYRSVFDGDEAAMERFLAEVCTPEWNRGLDAGRSWSEAIAELTEQFPEHSEPIAAYRLRWDEMLGDAVEASVTILAELGERGVRRYALSNWSSETFPIARPRYPFLEWFDGIVISGDVGVTKPDPAIYRYLLDRFGLQPGATAFIDDAEANVAIAADLGMQAIRFEDGPGLRRDLVRLGLLDDGAGPSR